LRVCASPDLSHGAGYRRYDQQAGDGDSQDVAHDLLLSWEPSAALAWDAVFGFVAGMNENTASAKNDPRKERLAKALRDNLKRRKAQMRGRAEENGAVGERIPDKVSGQKV
jgi:hypothetical protein